ncbi:MAG: glycosyl transferase family 28, partial [Saprospiraceae bacterium]|nr:glycosyl transferase family 28 [Saprospiraceae bacterium]
MPKPKSEPKILVVALDWGLGHAARCIPVVRELQAQGARVWVGGSGPALALLRSEFPDLPFLELPAYDIHYHLKSIVLSIGSQGFKILKAILAEHFILRRFIRRHGMDAVISDCRFGCFTRRTTCIFITHQLHIRTPYAGLSWFINAINHWFIRRYDELWIPDMETAPGLAGALSHPPIAGGRYIGLLSRMKRLEVPDRYDVVAVLSGPEPQRTILEKLILEQAAGVEVRMLVVRGKVQTGLNAAYPISPVHFSDHLAAEALNAAICAAKVILARSGYSTLMDLARIGKPAILIPTPGQTEQEY